MSSVNPEVNGELFSSFSELVAVPLCGTCYLILLT